jgi:ABC-type polysaccharide/polyol phosphate transport system ATPase subunit
VVYGLADVLVDSFGIPTNRERLRRGEAWSLADVSFRLNQGECLGLVGANGAGKSTLLRIINGVIRPDAGEIRLRGRVGALIEVGAGFHPQLTGLENVFLNASILGMSRREIARKLESILAFSGLSDAALRAPVRTFSSGMIVRLGFAVAIHCDVDLLLIDEVLAVGDMNFQAKCLNAIGERRRAGQTVVLVSHNLNHVAGWADYCLVLDEGRVLTFDRPAVATQRYSDHMLAVRGAASQRSEKAAEPAGSGRARLMSCCFLQEGLVKQQVRAGSPLVVAIDIDAESAVGDVEIDLKLFGEGGRLLVGASSRYGEGRLQVRAGRSAFRAEFSAVPINSGHLRASVAIWTAGRAELLDWYEGEPHPIIGNAASEGELHWMPTYRMIRSAEANERG